MKNLVTGGAGFLGSHLCAKLLDLGHEVFCIDDFSTGRFENIAELAKHPRFSFQTEDVCKYVPDRIFERIYNLACPASPRHYQAHPVRTTETNVLGALNLLEFARMRRARILQASTSEVYGDAIEHPQREDYFGNVNPNGPRACYDEGKRCAESLFCDYGRMYETDIRIVRIFNTYGPKMSAEDGRVIPNFINQAFRGEPLTIYGDGLQTRSFCYVDDLIDGFIKVMDSDCKLPVNLGNPHEISMYELANRVAEMTGVRLKIQPKTLPQDDPKQRCPDIGRARRLGWEPRVSLEDGLKKTIDYFANRLAVAA